MWIKALFGVIDKIEPVIDKVQAVSKRVANDYEMLKKINTCKHCNGDGLIRYQAIQDRGTPYVDYIRCPYCEDKREPVIDKVQLLAKKSTKRDK